MTESADRESDVWQFALGVTFVILAGVVVIGSVVRSLWLYPLS